MSTLTVVLIGTYEILAGLGILGWWSLKLAKERSHIFGIQSGSHIVAELITAGLLLVAGSAGLLGDFQGSLTLVGLGMLLYASVNIAGGMLKMNRNFGLLLVGEAFATAVILALLLLS